MNNEYKVEFEDLKEEKEKKRGLLLLLLLLFGVCSCFFLSVRFITSDKIKGVRENKESNWSIVFENLEVNKKSTKTTSEPYVFNDTNIKFYVNFDKAGDFYEFTFNIYNNGNVDAVLDKDPEIGKLTKEVDEIINYSVKYVDGNDIRAGDKLKAGSRKKAIVRVEFDKNYKKAITEKMDIELSCILEYVQD